MFIITILAGIMSAIVRFIMLIVISLFSMLRLDKPMLPAWALQKANGDPGNIPYISTVYNYHQHNDPILIVAAMLFVDLAYKNDGKYQDPDLRKKKIISNRLHLWLLMTRLSNIDLKKYRKKNIPPSNNK
jgi:hypothetical protein